MSAAVTILVPFRATASHWHAIRAWQYGYLNTTYPHIPVIVASDGHTTGPFTRSKALNNARAKATTDWLWVLDTDCAPHPNDLALAVAAIGTHGWIYPYQSALQLDQVGTRYTLQGLTTPHRWNAHTRHGNAYGLPMLHADLWDDIGGWDEHFTDWGYEDDALRLALTTLHGTPPPSPIEWIRTLQHPRTGHTTRHTTLNHDRYNRHYQPASGDTTAMRQVVGGQR